MKQPLAYSPHEGFIAPARSHAEIWRLVAGLFLAFVAYVLFNTVFFELIYSFLTRDPDQFLREVQSGETPRAMYFMLFSFVFMSLSVGLAAQLLHKRRFHTLLGPLNACARDFGAVSFLLLIVMAVTFVLPPWGMGEPLIPNVPVGTWIMLLAPSLILVLIQTSAEEIVFRGYVQQQLAARFASPLLWMILPAALFAIGHYLPDTAGENALLIALWAGVFGVLMADLTARAGNLGPAIAVHFWNNVAAILIISLPGNLSGLALYHAPFSASDVDEMRAWLPVDFALMVVFWLTARLAIRR
ncbi:MAG: CPBP family intramembrane glutamic endopeptidase [Pseudomonadota bacterium]